MDKKGVALLLALFILIIISLLVVAYLELTTTDLQIVDNHLTQDQALYIADSGIEYAIARLRNSKSDFSQSLDFPSGSGNSYSVTYSGVSGKIISTATLTSGKQLRLEAKVSVKGMSVPYQVKIISWREL